MKLSIHFFCVALLFQMFLLSASAHSQDISGRKSDIKDAISKISSNDAVERALSCNKALESDDPQLRSFALEACLQSNDRRVRDSAFRYIVKPQNKINIDIEVTERDIPAMEDSEKSLHGRPERPKKIFNARKLTLKIDKYNPKNDTFEGSSNLYNFEGSIGAGNLTFKFYNPYEGCVLTLINYNNGYLNGNFGCGGYSFAAKAHLP